MNVDGVDGTIADRFVKKAKISIGACGNNNNTNKNRNGGRRLDHPLGVKPLGNYFDDAATGVVECRTSGLGRLALLEDSRLLSVLNYCSARDLIRLAACSRATYVYASHDELWRVLVLEEMQGNFKPHSTWKRTYMKTKFGDKASLGNPLRVQGVYSDLLFQSFYCGAALIDNAWLTVENIARRSASTMTVEEFQRDFERRNVPVIITDAMNTWPALDKWTDEYLINVCSDTTLNAGGFPFSIDTYLRYARTLQDDQPLFIFDKDFAAKVPRLATDYTVPAYFREDFFALLGEAHRPDYRWLIIGPKNSGSSFHIDPNATNAWNSVIRGRKKWILFPPGQVPPGIHPSNDGSEVSAPVSLLEWFLTFYKVVHELRAPLKPFEGICRTGETMFVPHGWWHAVLNLEESIAITQNFVSACNLKSVVQFLADKPEQVSGCPVEQRSKLSAMFRDVMLEHAPHVFAKVVSELKAQEDERKHRKTKWATLVSRDEEGKERSSRTFSFGFRLD
ncbi:hypothetical protein PsorP6_018057 [Peronosclerospora sorghi]|uniref:Uncharacterized protein n=1 Tax=Peronosclerospora sorghi TaxID=230839 RepID=A0ACC0WEU3_9STRA|nr:hypothetical protein PsorP6_018057 [Peronosclerospora sorghi]